MFHHHHHHHQHPFARGNISAVVVVVVVGVLLRRPVGVTCLQVGISIAFPSSLPPSCRSHWTGDQHHPSLDPVAPSAMQMINIHTHRLILPPPLPTYYSAPLVVVVVVAWHTQTPSRRANTLSCFEQYHFPVRLVSHHYPHRLIDVSMSLCTLLP